MQIIVLLCFTIWVFREFFRSMVLFLQFMPLWYCPVYDIEILEPFEVMCKHSYIWMQILYLISKIKSYLEFKKKIIFLSNIA